MVRGYAKHGFVYRAESLIMGVWVAPNNCMGALGRAWHGRAEHTAKMISTRMYIHLETENVKGIEK